MTQFVTGRTKILLYIYSDVAWNPWAVDEIQGESGGGGKAASGEAGKGVDEAKWAFAPKTMERREVNPNTEDDAKSNPGEEGDAESNPGEGDDPKSTPIHMQSNFDEAGFVSMAFDYEHFLLNSQYPPGITKTNNIPFRERIGPLTHTTLHFRFRSTR